MKRFASKVWRQSQNLSVHQMVPIEHPTPCSQLSVAIELEHNTFSRDPVMVLVYCPVIGLFESILTLPLSESPNYSRHTVPTVDCCPSQICTLLYTNQWRKNIYECYNRQTPIT